MNKCYMAILVNEKEEAIGIRYLKTKTAAISFKEKGLPEVHKIKIYEIASIDD